MNYLIITVHGEPHFNILLEIIRTEYNAEIATNIRLEECHPACT
jgi:hypothetical protein